MNYSRSITKFISDYLDKGVKNVTFYKIITNSWCSCAGLIIFYS